MPSKTAPTITVSAVNATTPFGTAMADFLWTHNGHPVTHVGDIVNHVTPVYAKDPRGGIPGQAPVWYCPKDHKVFVDATNMATAPTVTNTAGAGGDNAFNYIAQKRDRGGAIFTRVGHIINSISGQDIAVNKTPEGTATTGQMQDAQQTVPGIMTLWYDQTNNVLFCDDVS